MKGKEIMKKIVENNFYDTGNFEITVENNYIKIENIDDASAIKKIEIYGKVINIEKAMETAEKYIEKVENRCLEYAGISKAFVKESILDFKLEIKNTLRKYDISEFLTREAQRIVSCFSAIEDDIEFLISDCETEHFIYIDDSNIKALKEGIKEFDEFMNENENHFFNKLDDEKEEK